jgi:hypothetical protein
MNGCNITKGQFLRGFEELDHNGDGVVLESDVDQAVLEQSLDPALAELVAILKSQFEDVKALHENGPFERKDGITRADVRALEGLLLESSEDGSDSAQPRPAFEAHTDEPKTPAELAKVARKIIHRVRVTTASTRSLYCCATDSSVSIKPEAIQQGFVGNCILLAALGAIVAFNPQMVSRMIEKNSDDSYTVSFPGNRDHPITIQCPTIVELAIYARSTDWGFWPAVIEKAYGTYMQEMAFIPKHVAAENTAVPEYWNEVFELLTGQKGKRQLTSDASPEELKSILTKAFKEGRAVTAASNISPYKRTFVESIPTNHAYAVIGWEPQTSKITLRNPWGSEADHTPNQDDTEIDGDVEGTFTINFDQFIANFCLIHYEDWASDDDISRISQAEEIRESHPGQRGSGETQRIRTFVRISGGLALIVVALVPISMAIVDLWHAYSSLAWPVTDGHIVKTERHAQTDTRGIFSDIEYSYEVGLRTYIASVPFDTTDAMLGIKLDYPLGKTVAVHYNPDNPIDSCLRPGFTPLKMLHTVFFGFLTLGPGLIGLLLLFSDNSIFETPSRYRQNQRKKRKATAWYQKLLAGWKLFWSIYP